MVFADGKDSSYMFINSTKKKKIICCFLFMGTVVSGFLKKYINFILYIVKNSSLQTLFDPISVFFFVVIIFLHIMSYKMF